MQRSTKARLILCLTAAQQLAACDTMWMEKSTVHLPSRDLSDCVDVALKQVPGVSIDTAHSTPRYLVLATPLQRGSRGPFAYLTRLEDDQNMDVLQVRFGEWGTRDPERDRDRIAPLLEAITNSLERYCARGRRAPLAESSTAGIKQ